MLGLPWCMLRMSLVLMTWKYSRGCLPTRLWGVTSICSSRYLCKFISFVCLFFIFIFSSVGRESPPHLRVPGLGGQGRICTVPCDDLGGRQFKTKERSDSHHERSLELSGSWLWRKTSNLWLLGRRSKALLPRLSRASSKLRSTTLCSSAGASTGSSFWGDTSSSTLLE